MENDKPTKQRVVRKRLSPGITDESRILVLHELAEHYRGIIRLLSKINPEAVNSLELTLEWSPTRIAKFWEEFLATSIEFDFTVFEDRATQGGFKGMLVERGTRFMSFCEHHMLPFYGVAVFAYIPKSNQVVGLSKIPRLIRYCSQQLTTQEAVTGRIVDKFMELAEPAGCGVYLRAVHSCVCGRGVREQDAETITVDLRGVFRQPAVKAEFETHWAGNYK